MFLLRDPPFLVGGCRGSTTKVKIHLAAHFRALAIYYRSESLNKPRPLPFRPSQESDWLPASYIINTIIKEVGICRTGSEAIETSKSEHRSREIKNPGNFNSLELFWSREVRKSREKRLGPFRRSFFFFFFCYLFRLGRKVVK